MLKFVNYWIPAILYAILIFVLSSFQIVIPKQELFPNFDKLAHFIEYGIFCFLFARAIGSVKNANKTNALYIAVIISALYGFSDEIHQAFVIGRECSFIDWSFDTIGALVFMSLKLVQKHK